MQRCTNERDQDTFWTDGSRIELEAVGAAFCYFEEESPPRFRASGTLEAPESRRKTPEADMATGGDRSEKHGPVQDRGPLEST